jgi:hypothetical protein
VLKANDKANREPPETCAQAAPAFFSGVAFGMLPTAGTYTKPTIG